MDKIKAWFKNSVTIAWARVVAIAGAAMAFLVNVADVLGLPGIEQKLSALLEPKIASWLFVAIGIVTELARRRTLP